MSQFGQVNVLPIWYYNLDVVGHIIAHLRSIAESFDTKIASITNRSKNLTKIIKIYLSIVDPESVVLTEKGVVLIPAALASVNIFNCSSLNI